MDRHSHPSLAIIYPPVDRTYMKEESPDRFWWGRLVPHVVFEDFKAMQKIEKTLRIIGFRDFRFYSNSNIPSNIQEMNRVWLCLPRNIAARNQLNLLYQNESKFRFAPRSGSKEAKIFWKPNSKIDKEIEYDLLFRSIYGSNEKTVLVVRGVTIRERL